MVKQDIKQCTQKYALSFQLPRMNTETPLLTLALFFALLQLITYYPLAVYMRERERERERCTCEFWRGVCFCELLYSCHRVFRTTEYEMQKAHLRKVNRLFFPLPFWWISQNYTENHFSPFVIKDHCLLLWTAWTFCYRNYLGDTTNF